jgi:GTP pyrophosphokinase
MADLKEILNLLNSPSDDNIKLVTKAYHFAEEAHKDQKRFSGDPYFTHLSETAKILAGLGMGPMTVAAGLLHDVIEDANVTAMAVEKEFGREILFLVEGVTKLGKLHYHGVKRYTESLRKLFVAMSEDLRVLIIKLSDRLHNMRTLKYVREDKQKRIASETLEIYAPLAYRLGIRKLNRELEDLAFPFVYPKEHARVIEFLKQKSRESEDHLNHLRKSIVKGLAKTGMVNIHTDSRLKGVYSLYQKLLRKNWEIEKIYDIAAVRIIVQTIEDCYRALGAIHGIWRPLPGRIKDYIAFPKPNGYQGLHTTIFTGDGGIIEIQIRTEEMHREAEFGVASHFGYKENLNPEKVSQSTISWVKQFIPFFTWGERQEKDAGNKRKAIAGNDVPTWIRELANYRAESESDEQTKFIEDLKADFFEDRVFIFTPKGDVVDLPTGSSPIDFAYSIHSDIGNHMSGAKVNGKLVSLNSKLENGDIVEIQVKESARPSAKWIDLAKTTVAKKHIRSALEKK